MSKFSRYDAETAPEGVAIQLLRPQPGDWVYGVRVGMYFYLLQPDGRRGKMIVPSHWRRVE